MAIKRAYFTKSQKDILSKFHKNSAYPSATERTNLAASMKKQIKHISTWFKNERARQGKKQNNSPTKPSNTLKSSSNENIEERT